MQQSDGARTQSARRLTAPELLARVTEVVAREGWMIATQLLRNGVDVMCGVASFVDPHRIRVANGGGFRDVTAANVLVASGTHAVPPTGIEPDGETMISSS